MSTVRTSKSSANTGLTELMTSVCNSPVSYLSVFKGTVANASDFSGNQIDNFRSTDRLIRWIIRFNTGGIYDYNSFVSITDNVVDLVAGYKNASLTGDATWLAYYASSYGGSQSANRIIDNGVIVMTISAAGGGGDVTIPNISIVSGESYRLVNLSMTAPLTYTY